GSMMGFSVNGGATATSSNIKTAVNALSANGKLEIKKETINNSVLQLDDSTLIANKIDFITSISVNQTVTQLHIESQAAKLLKNLTGGLVIGEKGVTTGLSIGAGGFAAVNGNVENKGTITGNVTIGLPAGTAKFTLRPKTAPAAGKKGIALFTNSNAPSTDSTLDLDGATDGKAVNNIEHITSISVNEAIQKLIISANAPTLLKNLTGGLVIGTGGSTIGLSIGAGGFAAVNGNVENKGTITGNVTIGLPAGTAKFTLRPKTAPAAGKKGIALFTNSNVITGNIIIGGIKDTTPTPADAHKVDIFHLNNTKEGSITGDITFASTTT
ncbi:Hypothetical predicted protein, partial [Paramuricea clavata]